VYARRGIKLTPIPDVRLHQAAIVRRYADLAPEETAMHVNEHVRGVQSRTHRHGKGRVPKATSKPVETRPERQPETPEPTTRKPPRYGAGF
jgi:hypothetical protein